MKSIIRYLMPPFLWSFFSLIRRKIKGFKSVYDKTVYSEKENLPVIADDAWSHENWIGHVTSDINYRAKATLVEFNFHEIFLLLSATTMAAQGGRLSRELAILDLGGGCGMYFPVADQYFSKSGIGFRFAVVDGSRSCKIGADTFLEKPSIRFFDFDQDGISRAHQWLGQIDILNCAGTLHYILDWKSVVSKITALNPGMICVSRHPTPDHSRKEGYVVQNITSSKGFCGSVSVVLIPANILVEEMARNGFELIAELGFPGDANWYWQDGCSQSEFKTITNRAFIFKNMR